MDLEVARLEKELAECREECERWQEWNGRASIRAEQAEDRAETAEADAARLRAALKGRAEAIAKAIYDVMPFDGPSHKTKPAWVENGNSLKQDEARSLARQALATSPTVTAAAEVIRAAVDLEKNISPRGLIIFGYFYGGEWCPLNPDKALIVDNFRATVAAYNAATKGGE